MPVETCLSKTLGCLNTFGALAVKSSGVLPHADSGSITRWDPGLGVAWLSSCKIVMFECSYVFAAVFGSQFLCLPTSILPTLHEIFFISA